MLADISAVPAPAHRTRAGSWRSPPPRPSVSWCWANGSSPAAPRLGVGLVHRSWSAPPARHSRSGRSPARRWRAAAICFRLSDFTVHSPGPPGPCAAGCRRLTRWSCRASWVGRVTAGRSPLERPPARSRPKFGPSRNGRSWPDQTRSTRPARYLGAAASFSEEVGKAG